MSTQFHLASCKFISLLVLIGSMVCAAVTYAATSGSATVSDFDTMKNNLATAGFTFTQTDGNLDILMDEAKVLAILPSLSKQGVIVKINDSDIKTAPISMSIYAMGVTSSVTIMTGIYAKDPNVDKLHVAVSVLPVGSTEKQPCYSFDYTRTMFGLLDLDKTSTNDFIAKTPGFTFEPWCKAALEKEAKDNSSSK